jgi:hypothetical protein
MQDDVIAARSAYGIATSSEVKPDNQIVARSALLRWPAPWL